MRISLPTTLSKHTARAGVVAAALAVAGVSGVTGATAASASTVHPSLVHPDTNTFNCVGSAPRICVGIDYSGDYVQDIQVQVYTNYYVNNMTYGVSSPVGGVGPIPVPPFGPGWGQQVTVKGYPISGYYSPGAKFCGSAAEGGVYIIGTCVDLP